MASARTTHGPIVPSVCHAPSCPESADPAKNAATVAAAVDPPTSRVQKRRAAGARRSRGSGLGPSGSGGVVELIVVGLP